MAFDIVSELGERLTVHPQSVALFTDASRVLFTLDVGPLNSDRGTDAMHDFSEWRAANPKSSLGACLRRIMDSFGAEYDADPTSTAVVEERLARDDDDFAEAVYALDESIIAIGLTQLIVENRIDPDAREMIGVALARQASPHVVQRVFGATHELRRRAVEEASALIDAIASGRPMRKRSEESSRSMARIAGTRIYAPSVKSGDGPPTDPEVMLKEAMEGGERPGGVTVSRAGLTHERISEACFWKLWEAGLELPGFAEIYFRPTALLPHGTFGIEPVHPSMFYRAVRMGVDATQFRAICAGQATEQGIELFAGALETLAKGLDLDVDAVERACAGLREHGLAFEVLLLSKTFEEFELRALLSFRPDGKHEIVVEHRSGGGTRRGVLPLQSHALAVAGDLSLVRGIVRVTPTRRSVGPVLKVALASMAAVD